MDHIRVELWIRGPTSSVKTSALRAFEKGGDLEVARHIFDKSSSYRENFTEESVKAKLGRDLNSFDEMLQFEPALRRLFSNSRDEIE